MSITPWPYRPKTLFSSLLGRMRSFAYGIRNLSYWVPVIWNDRNHHHVYISILLRHKLADMEHSISKHGLAATTPQTCQQLSHAVALLNRLIADSYWDACVCKEAADQAGQNKEQDIQDLFEVMSRSYLYWWD